MYRKTYQTSGDYIQEETHKEYRAKQQGGGDENLSLVSKTKNIMLLSLLL